MDMHAIRTRVDLQLNGVVNTQSTDFPGNYENYIDEWNLDEFKKNFRIQVVRFDAMELEFDMVGVDAAIANAFRRILLAEVPTMAVEKVTVVNNTSVIQDEVLAHRLGLIPYKADPRLFAFRQEGDDKGTAETALEFQLKIRCSKRPQAPKESCDSKELYINHCVYSKHIKWIPIGNQESIFDEASVKPVIGDILIAKLQPGHEIDVKMLCVKGIGRDHAKFSPVATASYRLLPHIEIKRDVINKDAHRLAASFSKGVIKIKKENGVEKAIVANARMDMCSRNVLQQEDLKDCVSLNKLRDHFIFSVESTGALEPDVLFVEAIQILKKKCKIFIKELENQK